MPRTLRHQYPGAVYQSCEWSSLVAYTQGKGPDWLVMDRLLNAFELVKVGLPTLQKSLSKLPKGYEKSPDSSVHQRQHIRE